LQLRLPVHIHRNKLFVILQPLVRLSIGPLIYLFFIGWSLY
jgi:hypothetical protein